MRAVHLMVMGFGLMLITACAAARLPEILPLSSAQASTPCCDAIFPAGRWQFHHQIDAQVQGRSMGRVTGVSVVSAMDGTIACALMTVEGLVLFSARYDGRLTVMRAVAPFDQPGFAHGLVSDLRSLFFKPEHPLLAHGRLASGEMIWRYGVQGGDVTDIVVRGPQQWTIRSYHRDGRRQRTIEATGAAGNRFPPTDLTIQSHGRMEYYLRLKLLDALPLDR